MVPISTWQCLVSLGSSRGRSATRSSVKRLRLMENWSVSSDGLDGPALVALPPPAKRVVATVLDTETVREETVLHIDRERGLSAVGPC